MRIHDQRIITVEKRPTLWMIQTSDGEKYATRDPWLASLALRYRESLERVCVESVQGWYYRDLRAIEPETVSESV